MFPIFPASVGALRIACFAVSDVDALYTKLRAAGVVFGGPPEDQPWGVRMVGLKDPDGSNLYLLQRF